MGDSGGLFVVAALAIVAFMSRPSPSSEPYPRMPDVGIWADPHDLSGPHMSTLIVGSASVVGTLAAFLFGKRISPEYAALQHATGSLLSLRVDDPVVFGSVAESEFASESEFFYDAYADDSLIDHASVSSYHTVRRSSFERLDFDPVLVRGFDELGVYSDIVGPRIGDGQLPVKSGDTSEFEDDPGLLELQEPRESKFVGPRSGDGQLPAKSGELLDDDVSRYVPDIYETFSSFRVSNQNYHSILARQQQLWYQFNSCASRLRTELFIAEIKRRKAGAKKKADAVKAEEKILEEKPAANKKDGAGGSWDEDGEL